MIFGKKSKNDYGTSLFVLVPPKSSLIFLSFRSDVNINSESPQITIPSSFVTHTTPPPSFKGF